MADNQENHKTTRNHFGGGLLIVVPRQTNNLGFTLNRKRRMFSHNKSKLEILQIF